LAALCATHLDVLNAIAFQVQRLEPGVLVQILNLADALPLKVEHLVELGAVRVPAAAQHTPLALRGDKINPSSKSSSNGTGAPASNT